MHEITCPHCNKAFKVDEAGYADILKQVRDHEFEEQLHERLELAEQEKNNAVELAKSEAGREMQKAAGAKDAEINQLKAKLEATDVEQQLAVTKALNVAEKERDTLENELEKVKKESQSASELAQAKFANDAQAAAAILKTEIQELKATITAKEVAEKLAITKAVSVVEKERDELKSGLERSVLEKELAEKSLKDKYETQISDRDDHIERLRDMKARLSTKMVGESLEEHCETEFNRIRATAFSRAYFEKDNDARTGSKGIIFSATSTRQALRLSR